MKSQNNFSFKFEGGDADTHQLNFYDASRFLYGASRFIYHLEYFRESGNIAANVRTRDIKFLLNAPQKGSFILDVMQTLLEHAKDNAYDVPLSALYVYIWHKLIPLKSKKESAKVAKDALDQVDKYAQIALESREREIELAERNRELEALDKKRTAIIDPYKKILTSIPEDKINRLVHRIRPAAIDMGKPLYNSAEKLNIQNGHQTFVVLDKFSIEALKGNTVSASLTSLLGDVIQFNKETGWGKFRNIELGKVSFRVPTELRDIWHDKIIDAMKLKEEVILVFYYVRDSSGYLNHLIFERIHNEKSLL